VTASDSDFIEQTITINIINDINSIFLVLPTHVKLAVNLEHVYEVIGIEDYTSYTWELQESESLIEVSSGLVETERKLRIEADTLTPAMSYDLTFLLKTSTGFALLSTTFWTSGEIDITNSLISITPSEGTALTTEFLIEASGFVDPEGSDLTYKFYYVLDETETLIGEQLSQIISARLPGRSGTISLQIIVRVSNIYETEAEISSTVDVSEIFAGEAEIFISEILDSGELNTEETTQFLNIVTATLLQVDESSAEDPVDDECGGKCVNGVCNQETALCDCDIGFELSSDCSLTNEEYLERQEIINTVLDGKLTPLQILTRFY
jgi:hypothetical protein